MIGLQYFSKQVAIDVFELWHRFLQNSFSRTLMDNVLENLTNWRAHLAQSTLAKETPSQSSLLKNPLQDQLKMPTNQSQKKQDKQETLHNDAQPSGLLQKRERSRELKQLQCRQPASVGNGHSQHPSNGQQQQQITKQSKLVVPEKHRHIRRGSAPYVPPPFESRHALPIISACHRMLKKLNFAVGGSESHTGTSVDEAARCPQRSLTPTLMLTGSSDFKHALERDPETCFASRSNKSPAKGADLLRLSDSSADTDTPFSDDSQDLLLSGAEWHLFVPRLEQRRASCPAPVPFLT